MTARLALLGARVSGSLSPLLHESAARALGHDLVYVAESCPDEASFRAAVLRIRAEGGRGINVTNPYKRSAFELSEDRGREAVEIGMVNTLSWGAASGLRGDNTDGPGLLSLFARLPAELLSSITILGGGGVARAALWAAHQIGAKEMAVLVRDPARMSDAASFGARAGGLDGPSVEAGLVVSALPPTDDATERALAVLPRAGRDSFLLDLAYGGLGFETKLVQRARALGHQAADGRSLLVAQAARSYLIWMGGELSAIEGAMRDALKKHDPVSRLL